MRRLAQEMLAAIAAIATLGAAKPLAVFNGNIALSEEVYRAVIDLPEGTPATEPVAELVREKLINFLHEAGYELAEVETQIKEGHLIVDIDEGRLDKVLIFGQGAYTTLRVKLELTLPFNVYNRLILERELARVAEKYHLAEYQFELVQVEKSKHFGPQLEHLESIQGLDLLDDLHLIPPERPYELHITLSNEEWETGLSPDISFNSLEGLGLGVHDRERDTFLEGDRLELRTLVAGTIRDKLDHSSREPVLGRVFAQSHWQTPPLIGDDLRASLFLSADLSSRQRADLGVEIYWYSRLEASLNVEYQLLPSCISRSARGSSTGASSTSPAIMSCPGWSKRHRTRKRDRSRWPPRSSCSTRKRSAATAGIR